MIMNSVGMNFSEYDGPEACVEALVARGLFNEARSYAQAHQLGESSVTIKEVEAKLREYENSCLWSLEKTRLDVWRQFQATFMDRRCDPEVAGRFFLELVQNDRGDIDSPRAEAMFTTPETVMLLNTALQWLNGSLTETDPTRDAAELNALETQVWRMRIEIEVQFGERHDSPTTDTHVVRMPSSVAASVRAGDDSFVPIGVKAPRGVRGWGTKEAALIDTVRPKDVPGTGGHTEIPLVSTSEERRALDALIGSLLNEGDLAAASKLATRFHYQSRDLLLAMTAFQLATEVISPGAAGERVKDFASENFSGLDTQHALQMLCQYCGPAEDCCRRLATNYTVARALNMSYRGMLAQEALRILDFLVVRGPTSFDLAQQFIARNKLDKAEVSVMLGHQYISQLSSRDDRTDPEQSSDATDWASWGADEFSQFANLCDASVLGEYLLDKVYNERPVVVDAGGDSHAMDDDAGELSPSAEVVVLCRAHSCFVLACNTDSIELVLTAARDLVSRFVARKQFQPLVRLLTSIKRYRDMEYVFDALVEADRFELCLAKDKLAGDAVGIAELKAALSDYLLRRHPKDTEKLQMVSLHFTMYREIGENRLSSAEQQIRALGKQPPGPGKLKDLLFIIQMLSEAAQNLMNEECQRRARQCLTLARLVGLQVQMVDVPLLNLDRSDVSRFMTHHPSFRESLIVAQAYDQCAASDWVAPIYAQVVQRGNLSYFEDASSCIVISPAVHREIASMFLRDPSRGGIAAAYQALLAECSDIFVQYELAKEVGLAAFAKSLEKTHTCLVQS
jgi:hypothetical protein